MTKKLFVCVNHFRNVVTTSGGNPTCRECGLVATVAEAESLQTLIDWEKARLRAGSAANRDSSARRGK